MGDKKFVRRKSGAFSGLTIAFAAAAIFLVVVAGTVAYLFTKTDDVVNSFEPGKVQCAVNESFSNNIKSSIKVENEGTTPAFMRVCFTTYWVEKDGNTTNVVGRDATLPSFVLGEGWVKGSDGYYYYTSPVDPEGETGELLGSSMQLSTDGNFVQVVEVFAQAIQSAPDRAVLEAWGPDNGGAVSNVDGGMLTIDE